MNSLQRQVEKWHEYTRISEVEPIARRAFANNSFDGVLTMIGVVMGNFFVGVQDASVVLVTGLSTALAIGVSGGWGAYLTESAERRHEISELERFTLTNLRDTKIGKASRMAVVLVAAVDGLSPFLAALLVLVPFFFVRLLPSVTYAYYGSVAMALLALFGLGTYLGNISRENVISYGLRTAVAGIVCIALSFVLAQVAG
ncbi:MAG: VIT1/CCC1 transporter family protein [Anaerolineae bacterium]|nr:VIT1/CCC1 transporter family protein [Anaerolineae bacterium]